MDLKKYAKAKGEQIDNIRKKVAFETYTQIVEKTPADTGRARGNWQIGIGKDPTSQLERFGNCSAEELPKLDTCKKDETIYIANNLPYICKLEYGGYGSNSPSGKTIGGYSKQAPQGMVGVTMAGIQQNIEKAIRESK